MIIIINTGNTDNHVLTLALMVLKGRAAESPNLVMAGAAIAVLPPHAHLHLRPMLLGRRRRQFWSEGLVKQMFF